MVLSRQAIGLSLVAVCGFTTTVQAQEPNVIVCDNCTTNARYAQAATNSFDDIPPFGIINGTKGVFVVNLNRNQNYYYEVTRSYDSPGSQPMIGDFFTTSARRVSAPPSQQNDIDDALFVFREIVTTVANDVSASDLGSLGFDSALDLVGPGVAVINRNTLQVALTNRFENLFMTIATDAGIVASRLVDRFVGENDLIQGQSILVRFSDGSTVRISVETVTRDISNGNIVAFFEVNEGTATIDGQRTPPPNAGSLNGFDFSTPDSDLMNNMTDLANRFPGVNFTGGVSNTGSLGGGSNGNGGGSGGCFLLSCSTIEEDPVCTLSAIPC